MRVFKAIHNFSANSIFMLITLIIGIISTPYILYWVGDENYGAYRALMEWLAYPMLLELGIGGALLSKLSRSVANNNDKQTIEVMAAGFFALSLITAAMLILTVIFLFFTTDVISVSESNKNSLVWAAIFGGLTLALTPLSCFKFFEEASQRSYTITYVQLLQSIIITVLSLLFSYYNFGVFGLSLANFIGLFISSILIILIALKNLKGLKLSSFKNATQNSSWKDLWQLNFPIWVTNLSARISIHSDNLILAFFLGPAAVTPFFLTQRLATFAQSLILNIGNSSWAGLIELYERKELDSFNNRLIELTKVSSILSISILVPIVICNYNFIDLWVGKEQFAGTEVSILIAMNVFLLSLFSLWNWVIVGAGKSKLVMHQSILAVIVNLTFSIYFIKSIGIVGPLLGTFISYILVSYTWLPAVLKKIFQTSLQRLYISSILPLILSIPIIYIFWRTHQWIDISSWFILIIELGGMCVLSLFYFWLLALNKEEKIVWKLRVKSIYYKIAEKLNSK